MDDLKNTAPVPKADTALQNDPLFPARAPFVFDRAEAYLILPALLTGYAFIRLIWARGCGIAVPTFVLIACAVTFLYTRLAGISGHVRDALPWYGVTAALTLPFFLFDGRDGRLFLTLCALFIAMAFAFYTHLGCRRYSLRDTGFAADLWNASVSSPLGNLGSIWLTAGNLARKGRSRSVMLTLAGILLGLPLLLIMAVLLATADAAFEGLLDLIELRLLDSLPEYFWSFLLGIPMAMIAFGILYGCRYKKRVQAVSALPLEKTRRVPAALALGMLIPTVLLCLAYLGSQLAYFFSAFSGLLPDGFSYAEYARRGFFELCAITVILLALISALNLFLQASSPAMLRVRQLISAFFCLFGLILTATALSKMVLYIRVYGVTPLRLSTTLFMLTLGVVLITVFLRLIYPRLRWVRTLTVIAITAVLIFSYTDMDVISLRLNCGLERSGILTQAPVDKNGSARTIGGFVFEDLVTMSDGIVPFLKELAASKEPETAALAARVLTARPDYRPGYPDPWTWNLARARADRIDRDWMTSAN